MRNGKLFARDEEPFPAKNKTRPFARQGHFRMDSVQLPFLTLLFIPWSHRMLAEISTLIHKAAALHISFISLSFPVFHFLVNMYLLQ